jgi:hypothetical protein
MAPPELSTEPVDKPVDDVPRPRLPLLEKADYGNLVKK